MPQVTVNPDAHPETNTVDGDAEHDYGGSPQSWATLRAAAGTGVSGADSAATHNAPYCQAGSSSNNWRRMTRLFMLFDISAIPAAAIISSTTLQRYITSKQGAAVSHVVIETSPASDTSIVAGDFDAVTLTALSDAVASGSISTSAYNTWTINAAGLAVLQTALSGDGIARLGMAFLEDVNNSQPSWSSGQETSIVGQSADGANKPKLTLTYAVPGGALPITFYSSVVTATGIIATKMLT